jgi:hypothetical protein
VWRRCWRGATECQGPVSNAARLDSALSLALAASLQLPVFVSLLAQARPRDVTDPELGVVEVHIAGLLSGPGAPADREMEVVLQRLLVSALRLEVSALGVYVRCKLLAARLVSALIFRHECACAAVCRQRQWQWGMRVLGVRAGGAVSSLRLSLSHTSDSRSCGCVLWTLCTCVVWLPGVSSQRGDGGGAGGQRRRVVVGNHHKRCVFGVAGCRDPHEVRRVLVCAGGGSSHLTQQALGVGGGGDGKPFCGGMLALRVARSHHSVPSD